jgi:hypothetical protein
MLSRSGSARGSTIVLPSSRKGCRRGGMNEVAVWRLEGEVNLAIGTLLGVHVRSTQVNLINQMFSVKLQVKSPFLGCTPSA